jgi:putative salt-induced outer membrane protein YdiY
LTGSIQKSDVKSLLFKTDYAGVVTIDWTAVREIRAAETLHVELKNGQTAVGPVTSSEGNLTVTTTTRGAVSVPKDSVVDMRNDSEQAAYEKLQHPGFTEGWAGGINVGFALTAGNSETRNLAIAFTADHKSLDDHLGVYGNSVYATNDAPGAIPSLIANSIQSGIRYDHNLNARLFGYVGADFQTDALQDLNLRSIFGTGFGFHAIKNGRTALDLLGGINYTRESYSAVSPNPAFTRNFAAVTLGEELNQKLGKSTALTEKLYFFPDLSDTGQYRTTFSFGTVTKMNKWLGWQNAFGDIYVTDPPTGRKGNDITFTTGLSVSFAH